MRKRYYMTIEKQPGNIWESTLYSKLRVGDDFEVEEVGHIRTDKGYIDLFIKISSAGWYDDYLNYKNY